MKSRRCDSMSFKLVQAHSLTCTAEAAVCVCSHFDKGGRNRKRLSNRIVAFFSFVGIFLKPYLVIIIYYRLKTKSQIKKKAPFAWILCQCHCCEHWDFFPDPLEWVEFLFLEENEAKMRKRGLELRNLPLVCILRGFMGFIMYVSM